MKDRLRNFVCVCALCLAAWWSPAAAHPVEESPEPPAADPVSTEPGGEDTAGKTLSGQGALRFRVFADRTLLPAPARDVLTSAHGGFAVDRRPGKGETYFALPGAGIIRIHADLRGADLLDTPDPVRTANMHNTTIWQDGDGVSRLTFPANAAGRVFTTTLDGRLVSELAPPAPEHRFGNPTVNEYFAQGGAFVPTDVAWLNGRYFITTGYSALDFVLTATVDEHPFQVSWSDLAFGGRGTTPGTFGTGHGITVAPGTTTLAVADRPHAEIDQFAEDGTFLQTLELPPGSFPCDIDYEAGYAVVGCLHGPDREKGAPIYLLRNGEVVSTILPKEDLGLERFQHVHNAVLHQVGGRLFIIAQAWNPGDFVILEQAPPP